MEVMIEQLKYKYNDGGRKEAGYQGDAGDCVVRAIAIATEKPYQEIYDQLFELNRKSNRGVNRMRGSSPRNGTTTRRTIRKYLKAIGWNWQPTMTIGSGCKTHLRAGELPMGRLIVKVSHHLCAVIDGEIQDTHNPSRDGMRCVYGYYIKQ